MPPGPKPGKPPNAEAPLDPKPPSAPVDAKGGSKSAVPAADPPPPHKPPASGGGGSSGGGGAGKKDDELSWIEIELKDDDGNPVANEPYSVKLPDGSVAEGTTDNKGGAKIEGFKPGGCEVMFPRLDKDEWKKG